MICLLNLSANYSYTNNNKYKNNNKKNPHKLSKILTTTKQKEQQQQSTDITVTKTIPETNAKITSKTKHTHLPTITKRTTTKLVQKTLVMCFASKTVNRAVLICTNHVQRPLFLLIKYKIINLV